MTQGVICRDSSAEQRRCFGIFKDVGNRRQCFNRSDHVLLIPAVIADAGNLKVHAIEEISATALAASIVMASIPAHTDALPDFPRGHARPNFVDDTRHFMPGNAWILKSEEHTSELQSRRDLV